MHEGNFYVGSDIGVWKSSDLGWQTVTDDVFELKFSHSDIFTINNTLVAVNFHELAFSNDSGATWQTMPPRYVGDDSDKFMSIAGYQNFFYARTGMGKLLLSQDLTEEWIEADLSGLQGNTLAGDVHFANDKIFAFVQGGGISIDREGTRIRKTMQDGLASDVVTALYPFGSTLFAVTTGGLSISRDAGESWTTQTVSTGSQNLDARAINDLFFDSDSSTIYIATEEGIYISEDNGASWLVRNEDNGLYSNAAKSIYPHEGVLYASFEQGIAISEDNGESWAFHFSPQSIFGEGRPLQLAFGNNALVVARQGWSQEGMSERGGISVSFNDGRTWVNLPWDTWLDEIEEIHNMAILNDAIYLATSQGLIIGTTP
ncbi:MAG: hypothetical protein AAF708_14815 [Deinococcota bacterium]